MGSEIIEWIGLPFKILGVSVAALKAYQVWPWRKYYSWARTHKKIAELKTAIDHRGIKPDLIVGTGRGGAIIGAALSRAYNALPILVLDRKYVSNADSVRAVVLLSGIEISPEFENLRDGVVLLVTSRSDPGITLREYKLLLERSGFRKVQKAAIQISKRCLDRDVIFVDEFGEHRSLPRFPWEKDSRDIMELERPGT